MKSLLRREEYRALSDLSIDGHVLDIGGSKRSGYLELIKGTHTYTVANIDSSYDTDVIFNAEEPWPIENGAFNGVLFINVLEHLYAPIMALREAHRALKNGGIVVGAVPFMFNVHGSPNDYFRYTRPALERMLTETGFSEVHIKELGTGAFSVIYHCLIGFIRWEWMATVAIPFFTALDRFLYRVVPGNKMSAQYMPLGYFFTAQK